MTAAVLDADYRLGSTEPRLFTPPLREHVDPTAEFGIKPEATWGPVCVDFLERLLGWDLLPWQKWLYYHALEKKADGTGFRFRQLVVLVGRQSGKTTWGRGLGLWRLYMDKEGRRDPAWPAAKNAVVAAQNLDYAEGTLDEVVQVIKGHPLLKRELVRHSVTNGKHRAILTYRRMWRAVAAYSKGGRSLSIDFAWMDEVREHTKWDAYNAIEPTTNVMPCSQLLITSNAGGERSVVLKSLRDTQLGKLRTGDFGNSTTGFFEWSVPEDVDPRDPQYWYMAQPALGRLHEFCLEDLLGKFDIMQRDNMIGFQTEYLCQWVPSLEPGVIPAQAWSDAADPNSRRAPGADSYLCIDTNYHRTRTFIAVAARRADGLVHTELIKDGKGTDWVPAYLNEKDQHGVARKDRFAGICAQVKGAPVSALIEDWRRKPSELDPQGRPGPGIPIADWGNPLQQLAEAAGDFYEDLVNHGTIKQKPSKALDISASSTVARTVGSDAWFFDRRRSPVDASPVIACCGAVWLLNNPPAEEGPPTVHEWPSDEVLDQWRKEAEEKWGPV